MPDLLLELFSEEIPARMQKRARTDLQKLVTDGLVEAGITYESAAIFSTPRRLCLTMTGVLEKSPTVREERKGPRVDAPEQALNGFLRSTGLEKEQLEVRDDKKGQAYFAVIEKPGRPAAEIIAEVVEATIRNFPWPKSMRWGRGSLRWVRPLHSILCILHDEAGAEVVPFEVEGLASGDTTEGHRFMAMKRFAVSSFEDYEAKLARAHVVLDAEARADTIWADATNVAFASGMDVVEDKGLLAEVAGLVEWPIVLMGDIAADFLDLPPEVLQSSMKEHQKFFSVRNPKTGRIEKFITVANRETADGGKTILAGNQKVLFARLSDAKFFWENDLRTIKDVGLEGMGAPLSNVTFHNKLGSQTDRIGRIAELAREIAPLVGADPDQAELAAKVAKSDLSSEMVYEFPDLQGLMGRYYAKAAGLPDNVANACEEHYSPMGPTDDVPSEPVSMAVALADKLDVLTGFWAIDEKPTGSKDPFALRRAALGVIRILVENDIRIGLERFIDGQLLKHEIAENLDTTSERQQYALEQMIDEIARHGVFATAFRTVVDLLDGEDEPFVVEDGTWLSRIEASIPASAENLLNFFHDRLKVFLRDQGVSHDVIDACLAMPNTDNFALLVARAKALQAFVTTDDGQNLLQGFKRANNILAAEEKKDGVEYSLDPKAELAEGDTEKALFEALDKADALIAPATATDDFAGAFAAIADLRAPIDAFFEAVQVNSDNAIVRRNRLCLLNRIRVICAKVADFSMIEG